MRLEGGAAWATEADVLADIGGYDGAEVRVALDDGSWSEWQPYSAGFRLALGGQQGDRDVRLQLRSFRGEAPFEHWLMRLAVRTCYDALRAHKRNRETAFAELTEPEEDWLDRFVSEPDTASENAEAARQLVARVLAQLSPPARLIITLQEVEGRSVKEISKLTRWSVPLVKVRAFRARAEMRKVLSRIAKEKYL